jgi:hypothetical protein
MNSMTTTRGSVSHFLGCALMVGLGGCGTTAEPASSSPDMVGLTKSSTEGAGFVHSANNSRFHLGANPVTMMEFGLSKLVGTDGVFATVPETGWVLAIPNATSPSRSAAPLTRSADVHNKTVVDYFTGAGLPADQVGGVNAHASVTGSGSGPVNISNGEFAGYTSVITRVVAGIPVPDSFAWASFNINGEAVEEQVYWPTVPASAVQEAKALQAVVSDPVRFAALASKLPTNVDGGQVVIRHSAGSERTTFEVVASYDVVERGELGQVRHFDQSGAEFRMASELAPAPAQSSKQIQKP